MKRRWSCRSCTVAIVTVLLLMACAFVSLPYGTFAVAGVRKGFDADSDCAPAFSRRLLLLAGMNLDVPANRRTNTATIGSCICASALIQVCVVLSFFISNLPAFLTCCVILPPYVNPSLSVFLSLYFSL